MERRRIAQLCFAVGIASIAGVGIVRACGEDPYFVTARFWFDARSSAGDEAFVNGQLGIIGPRLPASRLWIAYRHLAGTGVSVADRSAILSAFGQEHRKLPYEFPERVWLEARKQVPGARDVEQNWMMRTRIVRTDEYEYRQTYWNCLSDGYKVATGVLEERIQIFGVASVEVGEWLRGQDAVFANCSSGLEIPPVLDESWNDRIRDDRAYQRASAFFYAEQYEEAEIAYRLLAQESDSKWSATSRYMVARVMARDGRLDDAVDWLESIAADPSAGPWNERSRGLMEHYQFREDPEVRLEQTDSILSGPELPAHVGQTITDWIRSLNETGRLGLQFDNGGLSTWFRIWRRWGSPTDLGPAATDDPDDRPWLLARLHRLRGRTEGFSDRNDSERERLIGLSAAVGSDEPGYLTARYHRARLLIDLGRLEQAREEISALLTMDELSLADENRLRDLRTWTAETAADLLDDAVLRPVEVGYFSGERRALSPVSRHMYWNEGDRLPTPRGIDFLNRLSPGTLLDIEATYELPNGLRLRLVHMAWMRAVLLNEIDVARRASTRATDLQSKLSGVLRLSEDDAAARFDAVVTMITHIELSPILISGVGEEYPFNHSATVRNLIRPLRAPALVSALQSDEILQLLNQGWGVGSVILRWAEQHPDDHRIPEVLHRLVLAAKEDRWYRSRSADVSQAAFRFLHQRYPDSPWTEKTPYWYQ